MDIKKELLEIKEVLKQNPRGMTVMDISKAVHKNRHSVAKYLDMLAISGNVDVRNFGTSKVFYPSRRMPMSAILNFSSDFIIVLDQELNVVNVNDHFLEFEHVDKQDILNKSIVNSSFPMAFTPSIIPHIKHAINGEESAIEAALKKNGDSRFYNIKFIPTVFDDTAQGVTVIFEDITARREAVTALMESEERFRAIFENAAVGIAYLSTDVRFVRQNRRFCEILGYTQEDLMKRTYLDITYPEDRQSSIDNIALLRSGKINFFSLEKRYLKPDDSAVWCQITCSAVRDPDGSVKFFVAVIEDITARKAAEEALRCARDDLEARVQERTRELKKTNDALIAEIAHSKSMEMEATRALGMMREVLEKAPFGIYIVNDEGHAEYVNNAMLKLTGIDARSFMALDLFRLPTYTKIGMHELLRSGLDGKSFFLGPVEYTSHVGNKPSIRNFIGIPMEEKGKKKVLVFVEDFSKYRLLEEALLNKR